MVRTRDFLLFLITVGFLLIAIGFEIIFPKTNSSINSRPLIVGEISDSEVASKTAEVVLTPDNRTERIAELRKIIAGLPNLSPTEALLTDPPPTTPENSTSTITATHDIRLCPTYQVFTGSWTPANLTMVEQEGVRIWHETSLATSTTGLGTVKVILPIREFVSGKPWCLSSDVVGIATDGSLIRNNEYQLYAVFGESTLVGYALDGFPIYGLSSVLTDDCGGSDKSGSYRYYLNKDREGVIGCFAGTPTSL